MQLGIDTWLLPATGKTRRIEKPTDARLQAARRLNWNVVRRRMLKTFAFVALVACGSGPAVKPKLPDAPKQVDALAYLPAETTVVIGLDVARLRQTALWAKYKPRLEAALGLQLAGIKAKCGFDPFDVTTITAGIKAEPGDIDVIVVRGLDKGKTTACVLKQAVPLTTATADGDVITLHHQSGK